MKNDIYNQPKSVLDAINEILANEGKSSTGYELYHRDFSSAMKHAYDFAKKKFGIEIDPSEIDDKVATGPRKPSSGKTNRYRLMGKDKNGKTKGVQIQVANLDNKKYELNMYKEEIELDEARWEYKGNTNYKVGGNLRYDDKLDYKLSKADADILNKYMKQAKNDAARSKVWNMFWDSKETGDKAKGPEKAIAFAKKAIKEEVELDEKIEYIEYKFKNKNDAMAAKKMLDGIQLMSFDINDDNISGGELAVDAGKKDMTKYHKEIMKKYRPKVITQEHFVESWELDEMKMDDPKLLKIFDKLKKGSTVKIKIDSAVSKGKDYREFTVTAKNIVGKGKKYEQEKITLKAKDNPTGVKHFLYNRDGKVTLAIGDMGASIADIKEDNMSAYTAAITKGVK